MNLDILESPGAPIKFIVTSELTRDSLQDLIEKIMEKSKDTEAEKAILDLFDVPYIDSSAVQMFIQLSQAWESAGKTYEIIVNSEILEILQILKLDTILNLKRKVI